MPAAHVDNTSRFILLFMTLLACFTITQYCFKHDEYLSHSDDDLQEESENYNQTFYYGAPNAEFDWCERNFRWSQFVAEPINTITGLFFVLVPLAGEFLHWRVKLPMAAHATLFFTGLIAIGTVLVGFNISFVLTTHSDDIYLI
jgi:hypothetical protein